MSTELAVQDTGYHGELQSTAYVAPPALTFEQWTQDFTRIGRITKSIKWIAADLLLVAEERFSEESAQFFDALGYKKHTLDNIRWAAKRFPPSRRREHSGLSFSHFEAVAAKKFSDEEQEAWLDEAEENRWNVDELISAIKEARGIGPDERVSLVEPLVDDVERIYEGESLKGFSSASRGLTSRFKTTWAFEVEVAGHKFQIVAPKKFPLMVLEVKSKASDAA